MRVLTINAGSSSVRLSGYCRTENGFTAVASRHYGKLQNEPEAVLEDFAGLCGGENFSLAAHRVVHGGTVFSTPQLIDKEVEHQIEKLSRWAPLHNPKSLRWIRAAREVLGPRVRHVAVFDTGFYASMPEVARIYAVPQQLRRDHGIERYGFHGLAHEAMWNRWAAENPERSDSARIVSLQLGAGCSITATRTGRAVDTSMGFSPLEGLMMSTRSGDVDPGALLFLLEHGGYDTKGLGELLNRKSGLLGISGKSGDMKMLLRDNAAESVLAVELFCYRAAKHLGAMIAALGGVDAVLFGGGIGENSHHVRKKIIDNFAWCGVQLDPARNEAQRGETARIDSDGSSFQVWAVAVDEGLVLAEHAQRWLENQTSEN